MAVGLLALVALGALGCPADEACGQAGLACCGDGGCGNEALVCGADEICRPCGGKGEACCPPATGYEPCGFPHECVGGDAGTAVCQCLMDDPQECE